MPEYKGKQAMEKCNSTQNVPIFTCILLYSLWGNHLFSLFHKWNRRKHKYFTTLLKLVC